MIRNVLIAVYIIAVLAISAVARAEQKIMTPASLTSGFRF